MFRKEDYLLMRKKISIILCIYLLAVAVSGCKSEESGLMENSNAAAFKESSKPKTADAEESDIEQEPTERESFEQQQIDAAEDATPIQMQEITVSKQDYLLAEVPELWVIAHYVHQKTGGQAYFQLDFILAPDHQVMYQGKVLSWYDDYYIYAGVVWPDHEEEGIEFYVGKYEGQILCREDDEEELHTLEEWRAGGRYAARMDPVFGWQQEKAEVLLASEGESLDEPWYEAYRSVIMDWTIIEDFEEEHGWVEYLKNESAYYLDFCYEFYLFWLCDIDRNGTPELFLWDPNAVIGDVVVILTYTDRPVVIFGEPIDGVNVETGEIIIHGHWKGAGGTEAFGNEWAAYKLQGDSFEHSFYIDSYADIEEYTSDTPYVVNYPEGHGYEWQADGREYEEIYEDHVANCIPVENFVKYDMMDLSGLKDIQ